MSKIFHADIAFVPEYFNRTLNATIPPYFRVTCFDVKHFNTNIEALQDEELSMVADTPDDAVKYLISELKNRGLTGKLRVNRSYTV